MGRAGPMQACAEAAVPSPQLVSAPDSTSAASRRLRRVSHEGQAVGVRMLPQW
jgi:hypothetical protein